MIGRFVKNQEVYRFKKKFDHCQSGTFSTGKDFDFLVRSFAAKHEGTQNIPYLQTDISRCYPVYGIKHRQIFIQHLCLILCKITDLNIMTDGQFAVKVNLTHYTFHQCRFTFTVLTDKSYFLSPIDSEVYIMKNNMITIRFAHVFANHRIVSATAGRRKFQAKRGVVFFVHFNTLYLFQLLDAALYLHGFSCFIAEAFNEIFRILYLFLLILVSAELLFATFLAQDNKFVILHFVIINLSTGNFDSTCGYVVQESAVMAD